MTHPAKAHESTPAPSDESEGANELILSGVGIGVLGVLTAAVGGALCPVCVVAAPALLGVGAYRRWRASRPRADADGSRTGPPSRR